MIRTRKDGGYFIGVYLQKQQYDIIRFVAEKKGESVSDLIRMCIATKIEPMYQDMIKAATNVTQS